MKAFAIVGATGSGKTYFTKRLVDNILPKGSRPLVFDVNREWGETTLPPIGEFLDMATQARGRVIVFEDATVFFSNKGRSERMVELLVGKRHTRNTVILLFHGLIDVPLYVYRLCNFIVIHKTGDTLDGARSRDNIRKAVSDAHLSVMNDPDPHARRIVALV